MLLMATGRIAKMVETIWVNVCAPEGRQHWLPHALDAAVQVLGRGGDVLVHCVQGRHRTGMFLAALQAPTI